MRRKVTCTATTRTGELAALLIAQLDLSALVLLGGPDGLADDVAGAAAHQGYEPRVRAGEWADAAGADLVVVDAVAEDTAREIAQRCSGAVVVVATADPERDVAALLEGTRLPRARIVGVAPAGAAGPITRAARATEIVDAVLRDRRRALRVAVEVLAEDGAEGEGGVELREARVGAGGIQAIL
jgi:malate/lactate dehydrogenase